MVPMTRDLVRKQALSSLFVTLLLPSALLSQSRSSCQPIDRWSYGVLAEVKRLATSRVARDTVFHVPAVPPTSIALISDEQACKKAAEALTRLETGNASAAKDRQVIVVSVGAYWAVADLSNESERFHTVVIFDAKWNDVGGWSGP